MSTKRSSRKSKRSSVKSCGSLATDIWPEIHDRLLKGSKGGPRGVWTLEKQNMAIIMYTKYGGSPPVVRKRKSSKKSRRPGSHKSRRSRPRK